MDSPNRISMTPSIARQTPKNEFGNVLKDTLKTAANVSGSLLSSVPGGSILSAAVNNVTALTEAGGGRASSASYAASGVSTVTTVGSGSGAALASSGISPTTQTLNTAGGADNLSGMIGQMRAEADRSMVMQMKMQDESREYNTLSNVLKVRHDSAKSAINNIR